METAKDKRIDKTQLTSILWKKNDNQSDNQKKISSLILNASEDLKNVREVT